MLIAYIDYYVIDPMHKKYSFSEVAYLIHFHELRYLISNVHVVNFTLLLIYMYFIMAKRPNKQKYN